MTEHLETKGFGPLEIKDADKGEVAAVVATLNVVDRDGDVLLPGSFPASSPVVVSDYRHSVILAGEPPVGKGLVTVDGDKALFSGRFFLAMTRGQEAFQMVKEMGEQGEWSFGFPKAVKTSPMTNDWKGRGAKRLVAGVQPVEVSPVMRGAGVDTRTVSAKEQQPPPPEVHRVICNCGRVLGEATEPMLYVSKAADLAGVQVKGPRDARFCKRCGAFAVFVPVRTLTARAS